VAQVDSPRATGADELSPRDSGLVHTTKEGTRYEHGR
jgi:hypothetical protein